MADPKTAYFVAVSAQTDEVIVFANGGANRYREHPYSGELYAIYIRQEFQRRGIGRRLFCALASRLLGSGFISMLVWVHVNNPYRRFYESLGGHVAAERPIQLGPNKIDEVALVWSDLRMPLRAHCKTTSI